MRKYAWLFLVGAFDTLPEKIANTRYLDVFGLVNSIWNDKACGNFLSLSHAPTEDFSVFRKRFKDLVDVVNETGINSLSDDVCRMRLHDILRQSSSFWIKATHADERAQLTLSQCWETFQDHATSGRDAAAADYNY